MVVLFFALLDVVYLIKMSILGVVIFGFAVELHICSTRSFTIDCGHILDLCYTIEFSPNSVCDRCKHSVPVRLGKFECAK